jgi:hypothetical protein
MAIRRDAASPPPWETKSNLIELLKEKCGEEMESGTSAGDAGPANARQRRGL